MIFVLTIDLKRVYAICTFRVLVAMQVEQHHPHGCQMPGCAGRCHDVAATIVRGNNRAVSGRTGGDRTRDPNIKSVVLYQLSYSPKGQMRRVVYRKRPLGTSAKFIWYNNGHGGRL